MYKKAEFLMSRGSVDPGGNSNTSSHSTRTSLILYTYLQTQTLGSYNPLQLIYINYLDMQMGHISTTET
jgi:hypothetical protein